MTAPAEVRAKLDEIEQIQTALAGVNDLLNPDPDLDRRGRDNVACLVNRLLRDQQVAIDALRQALTR